MRRELEEALRAGRTVIPVLVGADTAVPPAEGLPRSLAALPDLQALALAFMAFLAPRFDEWNHHPRWGNEWKTVQIRLSTWDADNRITALDLDVARRVERAHAEFRARRTSSTTRSGPHPADDYRSGVGPT